jgi:alkylation response protein AidB-like acyl-CoA dehydrogenase
LQDASQNTAVVLKDRAAAVAAVRRLLPRIRARARQADADRRVPDETIRELRQAGLFGVLAPRSLGGSELGLAALVDVTVEIASACGSSGWLYGVLAGHSWLLNLFPIEAQLEVLADHHALIATVFRFGGEVRPTPGGGYRLLGGDGRFCSGIDHAEWVIVGSQVLRDAQPPEPTFFVIPRSDITEIVDDWFVAGMRGTGSKTIRVAEAFIPQHRAVRVTDMNAGTSPGAQHRNPIYHMPWRDVAPFSLIGVPLGIGRAAVGAFAESLRKPLESFCAEQIAEQSATFARLGVAAADIDAAYASVMENALQIDAAADPADLSAERWARIPRDWAYAAQRSRQAVTSLFEAAGGSATYDFSDLQRIWRDANAAAQHVAFTWDSAMVGFGRILAGVPPARFGPKGR